jgi:hypothetical protein
MTRTQWFNIDKDGQPVYVGWWEALYANGDTRKLWWNGESWFVEKGSQRKELAAFGNCFTRGEFYRGLETKPKAKGE